MNKEIEELTLLLLYLSSWQEDEDYPGGPFYRSWKGYRFETLDKLEAEGFISQGRRKSSKSAYLTEKGLKQAKELCKKYHIEQRVEEQ